MTSKLPGFTPPSRLIRGKGDIRVGAERHVRELQGAYNVMRRKVQEVVDDPPRSGILKAGSSASFTGQTFNTTFSSHGVTTITGLPASRQVIVDVTGFARANIPAGVDMLIAMVVNGSSMGGSVPQASTPSAPTVGVNSSGAGNSGVGSAFNTTGPSVANTGSTTPGSTGSAGAHTHSISGQSATTSGHSHGSGTYSAMNTGSHSHTSAGHAHTLASHTHVVGTHIHTTPNHVHTLSTGGYGTRNQAVSVRDVRTVTTTAAGTITIGVGVATSSGSISNGVVRFAYVISILDPDGGTGGGGGGGATEMSDLSDAETAGVAARDVLIFDGAAGGVWRPSRVDYTEVDNAPAIGTMAGEDVADYTPTAGLATVALTNDFADLDNPPVIVDEIDDLSDVDTLSRVQDDVLTWDDVGGKWVALPAPGAGGGASILTHLSDVTISSPANDESLVFDGSLWVNQLLRFSDGIAADPSIAFRDDPDTGLYRHGANALGVSNGGTLSTLFVGNQAQFSDGAVSLPGISFHQNSNTGIYRVATNALGFATAGVNRMQIDSNGQILAQPAGSEAAPDYSFIGDTDTGMMRFGVNVGMLVAEGLASIQFQASRVYLWGARNETTAAAANTFIQPADGRIFRSTSSARYKTGIRDWDHRASVLDLTPKLYRSTSDGDDSRVVRLGLIAEEVAEKFPLAAIYHEGVPDGVDWNMIVVGLLAEVKALEARVEAMEAKQ